MNEQAEIYFSDLKHDFKYVLGWVKDKDFHWVVFFLKKLKQDIDNLLEVLD